MAKKNREPDPLSVQISFRVRVPRGAQVSRKALNEAYLAWVNGDPLPPSVEIRGIFWRNPARKGMAATWRYSEGSDLKALKRNGVGIDTNNPRGDHEEARETLRGALLTLQPF